MVVAGSARSGGGALPTRPAAPQTGQRRGRGETPGLGSLGRCTPVPRRPAAAFGNNGSIAATSDEWQRPCNVAMKKWTILILFMICALGIVLAQQRRFRGGGGGEWGEGGWISDDTRTAREVPSHSTGTPNWTNTPGFEKDVFTFVRIRRDRSPYKRGGSWSTDTPDSDLNLSSRLQQMTSIK